MGSSLQHRINRIISPDRGLILLDALKGFLCRVACPCSCLEAAGLNCGSRIKCCVALRPLQLRARRAAWCRGPTGHALPGAMQLVGAA